MSASSRADRHLTVSEREGPTDSRPLPTSTPGQRRAAPAVSEREGPTNSRPQPTSTPGQRRAALAIGVIGPGRVGSVLGAALSAAGHHIAAVTPSSHPDRVRALLPDAEVLPAAGVARAGTDLLLVAVPDDALAAVVGGLEPLPGQVVAHTSGRHGLAVLAPVVYRGARPLALHPAMTFTGQATFTGEATSTGEVSDLARLPGVSYGVTAPDDLRAFATRLVADLGGSIEWVTESHRPLYHAALAHGANHLVTLVNEAADRLRQAGVREPARLLAPLLRAALENALERGDAALTGPVARGDAGTVAGHLYVLAQTAPDSVAAYRALARRTADRALATGQLPPRSAERLLEALADAAPAQESA